MTNQPKDSKPSDSHEENIPHLSQGYPPIDRPDELYKILVDLCWVVEPAGSEKVQAAMKYIQANYLSRAKVERAIGDDKELEYRGKKLKQGDKVPFDERFDDPRDLAIYVENNGKNVLRSEIRQALGLDTNSNSDA